MQRKASHLLAALAIATAATVTAWSSPAEANGRYPASSQFYFASHDPNLIVLRVTFGLLISHDRGQTWDWVCESAIGFSGTEDPMYALTPSGRIVGTTFQGLTTTDDVGCGWTMAGGDLEKKVFIDLASSPKDPKNIFVFASTYERTDDAGAMLFTSQIWQTKDEAHTFEAVGGLLDPGLLGYTLDLTTDPNRVYVSAIRDPGATPVGALLASTDGGRTWKETAIPLAAGERAIYIAAVDPNNANRVYLRTSGPLVVSGSVFPPEDPMRLLVADYDPDGGPPEVRTVYNAQGPLPGFALTADGSKVYVGGSKDGLQVANTSDFAFTKRSDIEIGCLAIEREGLWACSNERTGFIAGLSRDDGVTFEPKLRFCGIRGALACGSESKVTTECAAGWPAQKAGLGCGDLSSDAGANGAVPSNDSGCSVRVARAASPWAAVFAFAAAGVAALRRFRRKR